MLHSWWRHEMETFSALLAICAGNSPVHGEFPTQRPVTRSFDVFFDVRPNKQLSKKSRGWWFETISPSLWRHRNVSQNHTCLPDRFKSNFLCVVVWNIIFLVPKSSPLSHTACWHSGPRLNIKTVLSTYGDFHVKDKTAVRTSYL